MAWNLKQKAQDHIVSIGLGLIVLLLLVVWQAVPSSAWGKVSEVTPKRALWALLGLAGIAICLLSGALIDNRRKQRASQDGRLFLRFGMYWDKAQNPHCPADKIPLVFTFHRMKDGKWCDFLACSACQMNFPLWDSQHGGLTLAEAKEFIRQDLRKGFISD